LLGTRIAQYFGWNALWITTTIIAFASILIVESLRKDLLKANETK